MTWGVHGRGARHGLWSVHFAPDGLRGWAVGDFGTILATTDGGKTWAEPQLPYERWPAPWFWVAILPGLGLLLVAFRSRRQAA